MRMREDRKIVMADYLRVLDGTAGICVKELMAMHDSLGVYISVPFCKAKCTYCNFASGVFGAERMDAYVERVCAEIRGARQEAARFAHKWGEVVTPKRVDTVFFGGGTPSLLSAEQVGRLFAALREEFDLAEKAEVTLECAPGQFGEATLQELLREGMNRVSFGVQSFVDREAAAVGRSHTREMCLAEIARMRAAGVENINVDLIVGLPGQTAESWRESVEVAIGSGVPHVSVYMLEVDEDSRLGREVLRAGNRVQGQGSTEPADLRYGAGAVPSEDETAQWYASACEWLDNAGVQQYEISNFARKGFVSRHNVKYWQRKGYLGFGLDAHSMLRSHSPGSALRWANTDDLDAYLGSNASSREVLLSLPSSGSTAPLAAIASAATAAPKVEWVGREQGFEEALFLGMRMNDGVDIQALRAEFGDALVQGALQALSEVEEAGLVDRTDGRLRLTGLGRMVSNEVFGRLLVDAVV
jgi:oxygen-independent coproporphyrinogen-3 oxidase